MSQDFTFQYGSLLVLILITVLTLQKSLVELDTVRQKSETLSLLEPINFREISGRVTRAIREEQLKVQNAISGGMGESGLATQLDNFFSQVFNGIASLNWDSFGFGTLASTGGPRAPPQVKR